ncbi:MAG: SGNH/GDSL hydrolase family protein [Candidatus Krumholzibacteria bacterium]|nr:SGNH/GDSL hydrolase family protein [Candidatus Krumholzibacteria bacterium]MDH4335755.1 SGNH/GDSL hydrolase family protein [Candidatus Krumholzibacteria bacterium]MDH5269281.1 SGNH/GDSL hydrolase family protein [Candidatus Krumholzibacteria bacterium]MDH5627001.1 SGNH/GDSL hydrolase family protein [Candidatus Krumholzibacteria bacterium]
MSIRDSILSSAGRANALVLLVTVFVLLVGAEIALRITYHPENLGTVIRYDDLLGWSLVPNAMLISNDTGRGLHYRMDINSIGLREDEVDLPKPKGRKRVLILGDSIAFGSGVQGNERFSDHLKGELPGDVDIVNAGVPGWGTDQELLFYERDLRRLEADIVVLEFTANNDVVNNELRGPLIEDGTKPRFRCNDGVLTLEPPNRPAVVATTAKARVKSVLRKSRLLLFVKRRLEMRHYKQHAREDPSLAHAGYEADRHLSHWSVYDTRGGVAIETAWSVTECIFAQLAHDCREDSVRLIVFAFPLKIEVDVPWRDDLIQRTQTDPQYLDYMRPYRRMEAICAREGIEFVYPLDAFRHALAEGPLYFEHDSHPNAHAHAVAAGALRDVLVPAVSRR